MEDKKIVNEEARRLAMEREALRIDKEIASTYLGMTRNMSDEFLDLADFWLAQDTELILTLAESRRNEILEEIEGLVKASPYSKELFACQKTRRRRK